jgi:apolipoprotein N-acyltransferase
MVTFIPSVVAIGVNFRKTKAKLIPLTISSSVLIVSVFLFGVVRISKDIKSRKATAGLVVLDENLHKMDDLNFNDELEHIRNYELEISKLAARGARLIVLPERAININSEIDSAAISILTSSARRNHATIVIGYTNFKSDTLRNSALTIDEQGNLSMYYDKAKLVNVLEDQFTPGSNIGLFTFEDLKAATAICKDLDFPEYINQYGRNKVVFVCIPAWDFVVDDWLHSRMAILRGVENGFSEVRTARKGRLTISDPYGRVNAEADCSNGKATALVGQISLFRINTFYTRHGDWFGIVIATVSIAFFLSILSKIKKRI